jgi:hypothetical protein
MVKCKTSIMQYKFGQYLPDSKLLFNLKILPLPSQYTLSLLLFMIENRNQFRVNSNIYHIDTMHHANFHQHSVNLTK